MKEAIHLVMLDMQYHANEAYTTEVLSAWRNLDEAKAELRRVKKAFKDSDQIEVYNRVSFWLKSVAIGEGRDF